MIYSLLSNYSSTLVSRALQKSSQAVPVHQGNEAGCDSHLQEVLAGTDEGQLSTGAVRLRLAASDSLNQLRDLLCHHLMKHT